jgi:RNA polymerase sigma-70 factor (ECF subfamily)
MGGSDVPGGEDRGQPGPGTTGPGLLDREAVAGLYARHEEDLGRFLIGVLKDRDLARDALQATFAKVLERGHAARPESIRGWIFQVAYHEAINLRRRKAREDQSARKLGPSAASDRAGPEDQAIRAEVVRQVREALENLPTEQRRVVRARIYDEKTFAEIAQEQSLPLGTVLTRMRLALGKLRRALEAGKTRDEAEGDRP